jgi:hypothetical protein
MGWLWDEVEGFSALVDLSSCMTMSRSADRSTDQFPRGTMLCRAMRHRSWPYRIRALDFYKATFVLAIGVGKEMKDRMGRLWDEKFSSWFRTRTYLWLKNGKKNVH